MPIIPFFLCMIGANDLTHMDPRVKTNDPLSCVSHLTGGEGFKPSHPTVFWLVAWDPCGMYWTSFVSCALSSALGFSPIGQFQATQSAILSANGKIAHLFSGQPAQRGLYPPSEAHTNGTLLVFDNGHIQHYVYYEVHGNPNASLSALFLHGGPGSGCFPNHARFFDPKRYKIVLMDQRGSGRSAPRGEVIGNTLHDIISDCETLRLQLDIEKWTTILGGSWGVTVAVAYAQEYPDVIQSVILRGVCLFRAEEVDWIFSNGGYAKENPAAWQNFSKAVYIKEGKQQPREVLMRYYDRLLGDNPNLRLQAAKAWMQYEMTVFASSKPTTNDTIKAPTAVLKDGEWTFYDSDGNSHDDNHRLGESPNSCLIDNTLELCSPLPLFSKTSESRADSTGIRGISPVGFRLAADEDLEAREAAKFVPAQNMLTCFFSVNREFVMGGTDLLDPARMKRIQHIPCIAVHGGRDRVCPLNTALDLARKWPNMKLIVPIQSGHSMYDPAITNEVVLATDEIAEQRLTSNSAMV